MVWEQIKLKLSD